MSPADALIAVVPLPHHAVDALALDLGERVHDRLGERRRRIRIGICSGDRVRYDLIDDVEAFQLGAVSFKFDDSIRGSEASTRAFNLSVMLLAWSSTQRLGVLTLPASLGMYNRGRSDNYTSR